MIYQELYQKLYTSSRYGRSEHCPGLKLVKLAKTWLHGAIIDLGCGTGETVHALRKAGFPHTLGMDQVNLNNGMLVGDISSELDLSMFQSAFCADVFEHMPLEDCRAVLRNMCSTHRQLIAIHNGPSRWPNPKGELHITQLHFEEWERVISEYLDIHWTSIGGTHYRVYLCERKQS